MSFFYKKNFSRWEIFCVLAWPLSNFSSDSKISPASIPQKTKALTMTDRKKLLKPKNDDFFFLKAWCSQDLLQTYTTFV